MIVYVLHVVRVDNLISFGTEEVADLNAAEKRFVGFVSERFDGAVTVHRVLRRGVPSERIVEFTHEIDADLIIIDRHGGDDLLDYLLGRHSGARARDDVPADVPHLRHI